MQVVDPDYRSAKVLKAFTTSFSLAEHGVLEAIGQLVCTEPVSLTAKLDKVCF